MSLIFSPDEYALINLHTVGSDFMENAVFSVVIHFYDDIYLKNLKLYIKKLAIIQYKCFLRDKYPKVCQKLNLLKT